MLIYGDKLIDKDFRIGIFDGIKKKMPPLQEYLNFMFKNKQGSLLITRKEDYKVLPWVLLRSELFYPTRKYIVNNNSFCIELTRKATSIFRVEFSDEHKATAK